jgi:uncharacterized membrane protein YbhN (UPF0104 family)
MSGRKGRRRAAVAVAFAVLATVAAVGLIGQAADFGSVLKRLRSATPGWLVVCALGQLIAYLGAIVSYQAVARFQGGPRLPLGVAVRVVGLSFGAYAAATTLGGLSVDFWALHEAGEPLERASARVIAFETLRWALLAVATAVAGVVVLVGAASKPHWPLPVAWLALVPACFAAGLWISAPRRRARFTGASGRLARALGVAVAALVYMRELMVARSGERARALGGAAVFWAGDLLCAWAALRAFGANLSLAPLLLAYSTGLVAEGLPLPAGGSGSVDAALTGAFALVGVPLSEALLAAVTFRVFNFWLPALVAGVSLIAFAGLRRRLEQIADARAVERTCTHRDRDAV